MISHKHTSFFVCIPKTGTTSAQSVLAQFGFRRLSHSKKHLRYSEYEDVKNYFSFTFVRNPWARLVSQYRFSMRYINVWKSILGLNLAELGFTGYIRNIVGAGLSFSNHLHPRDNSYGGDDDWGLLQFLDAAPAKRNFSNGVDFVGKLENFQEDFNIVCDKLGIPHQILPHRNKTKHKHYTEYYDDETKEIVAEKYAEDIEYFGYEFGD